MMACTSGEAVRQLLRWWEGEAMWRVAGPSRGIRSPARLWGLVRPCGSRGGSSYVREIDGAASPAATAAYADRHLGSRTVELDEWARILYGALRSKSTPESRRTTLEDIRNELMDPEIPSSVPQAVKARAKEQLAQIQEKRRGRGHADDYTMKPTVNQRTGWTLPPLGHSCLRLSSKEMFHHQALSKSINSGVNFLDTASVQPESELVVSEVMQAMLLKGEEWEESSIPSTQTLDRDELIFSAMAGFVMDTDSQAQWGGQPLRIVGFRMDAESLEAEITRILNTTGTVIDFFMLHNPETVAHVARKTGDEAQELLDETLRAAFEHLELEVRRGRIQYYGVCSERFVLPPDNQGPSLSVGHLLRIAESVSPKHHFAGIKFPFNLLEPNVGVEKPASAVSVAAAAKEEGLLSVAYRPLTAVLPGDMARLIDYDCHDDKDLAELLKEAFELTIMLEKDYPGLRSDKTDLPSAEMYCWGQILSQNQQQYRNLPKWKEILGLQIMPALNYGLTELQSKALISWASRYHLATQQLFRRIQWTLEHENHHKCLPLSQLLQEKSLFPSGKLQDAALQCALSTGATTVSLGIRDEALVAPSLDCLRAQRLTPDQLGGQLSAFRKAFYSKQVD